MVSLDPSCLQDHKLNVYSVSVNSYQYLQVNFDFIENIEYSSMASFTLMFLVNDRLVWRDKTVPRALELCMVHMLFMFFTVYKNLKSSFSEDHMSVHALDVFIDNATKMV